ncbi:serine hydrolase domain-containing protein [Cryobacterium roopkundense]|uniref:CubicO group peptidase (Beta-lactamase class C family) n=1 Tax=Cryobacterium roopkundense TaxID=1001240 RepID=A0A7W9E447_9MICO|nr:serine hydrolase domain-containing protein [Cryobacterium roopkundense]MBB5641049.1 CubicO group peptidase (beta-lactamase class C family) [Cryobacterium roopkundense]
MDAEQLIETIRPLVDDGEVPGAVVGVLHGNHRSVAAVGQTEPGGTVAMPVNAVMRISSNTKPMVAAVALLLVQDGVLNLDDTVEKFVPELTGRRVLRQLDGALEETVPAQRSMTIADLLTMRMGFGFVFESTCPTVEAAAAAGLGFGPPDPSRTLEPSDWVTRFAALPLLEQPGTVWRYELAYALLGVVLSRAAESPLDVLMRERLFTSLAMFQTGFVASPRHLVPAFAQSENGLVRFDSALDSRWSTPPAFPDARGGLVSTVSDMLRFARMLLNNGGGLLSPESAAAMTSDQLTAEQRSGPSAQAFLDGGGWGYGVGITNGEFGRRYGWGGGLGTLWYSWPEHDVAVALMTQVLPPSTALFDAFTNATEATLRSS